MSSKNNPRDITFRQCMFITLYSLCGLFSNSLAVLKDTVIAIPISIISLIMFFWFSWMVLRYVK